MSSGKERARMLCFLSLSRRGKGMLCSVRFQFNINIFSLTSSPFPLSLLVMLIFVNECPSFLEDFKDQQKREDNMTNMKVQLSAHMITPYASIYFSLRTYMLQVMCPSQITIQRCLFPQNISQQQSRFWLPEKRIYAHTERERQIHQRSNGFTTTSTKLFLSYVVIHISNNNV